MVKSSIHIFIFCFNEAILLPQTIKHYKTMLPHSIITIYDNESTDNSVKIARDLGCNIISWSTNGIFNEIKKKTIFNNCWKGIKEGWVIVCDMDEWLCITEDDLQKEQSNGTTILSICGYNITGMSKDKDLKDIKLHSLKRAYYNNYENKNLCFHLPEIKEMNYGMGSHTSKPKGIIKYSSKLYVNKHMNDLGLPFLINKMKTRFMRTRKMRKMGFSTHYINDILEIKKKFYQNIKNSKNLRCDTKGYCYTRKAIK